MEIKIKTLIIIILFSGLVGWMLCAYYNEPSEPVIVQYPINAPVINDDINKMDCEIAKSRLKCYFTGDPVLDIKHLEDDEYLLSAGLCERAWNRLATIKERSGNRNIIIGGVFYDTQLRLGGSVQYYRFFGRLGLGGGLALTNGYGYVNGGVAWKF